MKKSFAAWRRHGLLRSQSVVGSNPTDNESCRSSMAEQRHPELLIPAAKNTDVVKVRVTSTKQSASGNWRDAASENRLSRERQLAQKQTRTDPSHRSADKILPANNARRRTDVGATKAGMVRRRATSSAKRRGTVVPLLSSIFLPVRICGRRTKLRVSGLVLRALIAGRGEGQGYFAY